MGHRFYFTVIEVIDIFTFISTIIITFIMVFTIFIIKFIIIINITIWATILTVKIVFGCSFEGSLKKINLIWMTKLKNVR